MSKIVFKQEMRENFEVVHVMKNVICVTSFKIGILNNLLKCLFLRSIRWLDRCIKAHNKTDTQNLFGIVQGGLNKDLRTRCAQGMYVCIMTTL